LLGTHDILGGGGKKGQRELRRKRFLITNLDRGRAMLVKTRVHYLSNKTKKSTHFTGAEKNHSKKKSVFVYWWQKNWDWQEGEGHRSGKTQMLGKNPRELWLNLKNVTRADRVQKKDKSIGREWGGVVRGWTKWIKPAGRGEKLGTFHWRRKKKNVHRILQMLRVG